MSKFINSQFGDSIEQALIILGVTKERVSKWLGKPCNCEERQRKLNELGTWAVRVVKGKTSGAIDYLNHIISSQ